MRKLTGVVLALSLCAGYGWAQDGTLKWRFPAYYVIDSPAIGADGTVYAGSWHNRLYAIYPDGTEKWAFSTGDSIGPGGSETRILSSPAIGADGTIYVGFQNDLYAIRPDGTEKWHLSSLGYEIKTPAIGADGTIYVGVEGSDDRNLYAIRPDGTVKWRFEPGSLITSTPAIGPDGTVYLGSDSPPGHLYAIHRGGSEKWRLQLGTDSIASSPAIGPDGTIYVGSWDNHLYAIHPDGTEQWRFKTEFWITLAPAIGPDGTIYVGSSDNHLYAINPDGTERWRFATGDSVASSPAIGADGTIYVGSDDSNLYAVRSDGTEKWRLRIGYGRYPPTVRSPAIGADGTIYVGTTGDYLYAINSGSGGLAETAWPMSHHDARQRGRSGGPGPDCRLNIEAIYTEGTLNLNAQLGNTEPVTWNGWLIQGGQLNPMWSSPLDVIDPPSFLNREIPDFPQIGPVIIVTAMKAGEHYICSDTALVGTGTPTAAPSTQELQDLFRGLAP